MQTKTSKLIQVPCLILFVFLSGCSTPTSTLPPTKSQFYQKCSDWSAIIDKCIPDKEIAVENKAPSLSEGGRTGRLHNLVRCDCQVRATPEGVGRLVSSLKSEVKNLAQQMGVEIDEENEGQAVEDFLGSYEFE